MTSFKIVVRGQVSYATVHQRLRRTLGRATEYQCLSCGKTAEEWSYQNKELGEIRDSSGKTHHGRPFSNDYRAYEPMCRSCHRKGDAAHTDPRRAAHRAEVARLKETTLSRECLDCAKVASPGSMGGHLKWSGHSGYREI